MAVLVTTSFAQSTSIRIDFTPNSPTGFSPVSAVFHDGSYNAFNAGDNLSGTGLELLAETGDNSAFLSEVPGSANVGTNGENLAPGESVSFTVDVADTNTQFNFASMVLFSNDWFVGNSQANTIDISSLIDGTNTEVVFDIADVYDAGTETEDYTGVGGSGFFPFSTSGSLGVDIDNGSVSILDRSTNPYLDFTNTENLDLNGFDPTSLDGITAASLGSISLTVVPEPSTFAVLAIGAAGLFSRRRR